MGKLRKTEISKSGIIKAHRDYDRNFVEAYIFALTLSSQSKHPIILNYKPQLSLLPKYLKISDHKFRKLMKACLSYGLFQIEGNNLRLWSRNQDRAFKVYKRNDYRKTSDPILFAKITLFEYHQNKQQYAIKSQTSLYRNASGNKSANNHISCSARAISKLFCYKSSASGFDIINYMTAKKHIALTKNTVNISKQQFREGLKNSDYTIRYDNNRYYKVLASTYEMVSSTKRRQYEPYYNLNEREQNTYLEMGYNVQQINNLLA